MMDLEVSSYPPNMVEGSCSFSSSSAFSSTPSHLLAECAVCHQKIPKGRVHYGGVSCYSCRAFFRRNTQRDELPTCKSGGGCTITHQDRKQCSACRYVKCISIGMRKELVLDASGKQERFKKYLRKKNDERVRAEEHGPEDKDSKPMPPLAPIPGMNFPMSVLLQRARSNYQLPYFPQDSSFPKPDLFPGFRFPLSSAPPTMAAALSPAAPVDLRRATSPATSNFYSNPPDFPCSSSLSPSARISPSLLPVASPSLSPRHLPSTILLSPPLPSPPHHPHHTQTTSFAPSLALLQRSSVISKGEYFNEEKSRDARSSSSEVEDGASSSKRRYWPLPQILENSLPLQVEIKEEVLSEPEDAATEEDSLLQKYCHKKFQKAKTFSSDLRLPLESADPDNRKRRSVIVQAPSSRAKVPCAQDLRAFRMSRHDKGEKEYLGERSAEEEESYSPVDLSCSSAASSPRGESGQA